VEAEILHIKTMLSEGLQIPLPISFCPLYVKFVRKCPPQDTKQIFLPLDDADMVKKIVQVVPPKSDNRLTQDGCFLANCAIYGGDGAGVAHQFKARLANIDKHDISFFSS